jgi:hypothetical protein
MPRPLLLAPLMALLALSTPGAGPLSAQHTHDHDGHDSPYTKLEGREIKALSQEEVMGLMEGEGMGFALAAELNGIPGPLHVLELRGGLELTRDQVEGVRRIFQAMRERTAELGAQVVDLERTLDRRFRHRHVDGEAIRELTHRIALLKGEIRAIHLEAHLEVDPLLTQTQREAYLRLRGYH